jgi:hypothetical protein
MTSAKVAVPTTVPDFDLIRATGPIFFVNFDLISHFFLPSRMASIMGA